MNARIASVVVVSLLILVGVSGFLFGLWTHFAGTDTPEVYSRVDYEIAVIRAYLVAQYAEHGEYPNSLPSVIDYKGRPFQLHYNDFYSYEATATNKVYTISWTNHLTEERFQCGGERGEFAGK